MNLNQKHFHQMLGRVLEIPAVYPQFFETATLTRQLMDEVEAAGRKIHGLGVEQKFAWESLRVARLQRLRARKTLKARLKNICGVAKALGLENFWLPLEKNDRAMIQAGLIFASHAERVKSIFMEAFMPLDFIDRLELAARNLEKSIQEEFASISCRVAATAGIEQAQSDATTALMRLDAILANALSDQPATFAHWRRARRMERRRQRKLGFVVLVGNIEPALSHQPPLRMR